LFVNLKVTLTNVRNLTKCENFVKHKENLSKPSKAKALLGFFYVLYIV
jgi:uncharacterized protein YfkK (UPF0435 family)